MRKVKIEMKMISTELPLAVYQDLDGQGCLGNSYTCITPIYYPIAIVVHTQTW